MTCEELWMAAAPAGERPELDGEAGAHVRQCPACAAEYARHRRLAEGLRLAAGELRRVQAPERVEARLLATFRGQTAAPSAGNRRDWLAPAIWWAAAATLAVCAGLFLSGARPTAPPKQAKPAAKYAVELADLAPGNDTAGEAADETSGFVPVRGADALAGDEAMDLVRVVIPRSAMIAYGIPLSADDDSENVEADLLLGPDGRARAVRLID